MPKTLLKQPKIYFWDWSIINDTGQRYENFVASHLLKAVHIWSDSGYGSFDLYFLRDKTKREVDFLISKNSKPWIIVEVKSTDSGGVSPSLKYFYSIVKPEHAFQVDFSSKYTDSNCFTIHTPVKVPAMTLLSQLI